MASLDLAGIITRACADLKNYFALKTELDYKQDKLIDAANIKTIDGNSLLGSGDLLVNTDSKAYIISLGNTSLVAIERGYSYRLWLTSANGENLVPINTSSSTDTTTTKALNTRPIDPFGLIIYNDSTGAAAGQTISWDDAWKQYPNFDIRYSYVITLTTRKPIYLKCTPQADGSAVMADIVQALPTSNDGMIYIFLGVASSTTKMELYLNHPVYYHDGVGIRIWEGGTLPIAFGGTGATTAADARTNLGVPGLATSNTFTNTQSIEAHHTFYESSNIDIDGGAPASNTWSDARILFRDVDGENIGQVAPIHAATDRVGILLYAQRGSGGINGLYLMVNDDDTPYVSFSGTGTLSAWRNALGLNTWTTVSLSDFATAASGWAFSTSNCNVQYNSAIGALRVRLQIATSAAQTAGQKTIFTVKTAYRPKTFAASLSSLTSYAQAGQIYTSGGFAVNIIATPASTNLYFNGVYFIGA